MFVVCWVFVFLVLICGFFCCCFFVVVECFFSGGLFIRLWLVACSDVYFIVDRRCDCYFLIFKFVRH